MNVVVLDPTYEDDGDTAASLAPRPRTLAGATVGIISNGKANTRPFFDHVERLLYDEWKVREVVRRTKPNYSAPAPTEMIAEAAGWAALFAGVGD